MATETTPAALLTSAQLIALGDEVHGLAMDHAITSDIDSPADWANHCRFAVQEMARGARQTISTGSVFECIWLAQVGYASGPTDIRAAESDASWTLAA